MVRSLPRLGNTMSERDQYKEKFRPDVDSALDREIAEALGEMSIEELYDRAEPKKAAVSVDQPAGSKLRKGRIIAVNKDEVFVDLGGKSQGIVPFAQFETEPKIGDEMEFHVDHYDAREGLYTLTRKGAVSQNVNWENLEVGQVVEGTVTGMNKGGLEVQIKQMRGFMPAGQVDVVFHQDISIFIGQRVTVEVQQFDRERKNLIVSRRNIIEREREAARQKMLTEIVEGQIRRGTVRNIMDFGAFVDLGGLEGLIHVSEMSWRRLKHPSEMLKVGDIVEVKIVKIDREAGRIGLSLKQAGTDPWVDAGTRYATGTVVTARVARVEGFGAFLEVEEGIEGLLPISEMSWQRIKHPSDVVKVGDTVKVVVLQIDPVQKRLSFSLKQAGGDPWAKIEERYAVDMVTTGKVTRVADFGAFVELEAGLEGLVHISEMANQRVKSAGDVAKVGQEVKVRVLEIDKEKRRIALSIKRAEEALAASAPAPVLTPKELEKKQKKRAQLRGGLDF